MNLTCVILWNKPWAGCLFNQVNLPAGPFSTEVSR